MGYYCNKEIASVVEPSEIALANNPNFVVFSSKNDTARDTKTRVEIDIKETSFTADFASPELDVETMERLAKDLLKIEIRRSLSEAPYTFQGTYNRDKVDDKTFYVAREGEQSGASQRVLTKDEALAITASNLKYCLMQTAFLRNNFEINILDFHLESDILTPGHTITLVSKGSGVQYDLIVTHGEMFPPETKPAYIITVNVEGFTDKMIEYQVILCSYKSPITGGYVTHPGAAVFANDKFASSGATIVYRRQEEPGLTWEECNKKTLASLCNYITKQYGFRFLFDVVLDSDKGCIKLFHAKGSEDYLPYVFMLSPNIGSKITLSEKNTVFITSTTQQSVSTDTIDYGMGTYQIELDVYTDHQVFPGNNDTKLDMGSYMTTLSKSYFGQALWFELSTLLSKKVNYSPSFLTELELDEKDKDFRLWSNADTMTNYRFIAKLTDGAVHQPFYYSSPLYVLNGYNYTLDPVNLKKDEAGNSYILDFSQNFYTNQFTKVKPLTTNFARTHIKGQKQYFNYIHKFIAPTLIIGGADNLSPAIGLHYKIYTQSGTLIGKCTRHEQQSNLFNKVNTALLQLDQFLPMYKDKTIGRIDVYLCRWHKSEYLGKDEPEVIISTPLSFRILPEVLNEVNDFVFLNQLGGWDTMNFGGGISSEFKSTSSTIYKTLQPDFTLQTEIESVATKSVQEQNTVQTSPITKDTVQWLRQMSASPAVYELSTRRYILIDDMSLKYNSTDDLYQVEMKYHYTDTFK